MPRVAKARPGRVLHPKRRYAYLMQREGVWYAVYKDRRRSTGLLAQDDNIPAAIEELDRFIYALTVPAEERVQGMTVLEALPEFIATKKGNITEKALYIYLTAIERLLPGDCQISDPKAVREQIAKARANSTLKPSTMVSYLHKLSAFFDWCIRAGYCTLNPLAAVESPKFITEEPVMPTWGELEQIYAYLRSGLNYRRYPKSREHRILVYRFLSKAGLRINEFMTMTTNSITREGIIIDGKRSRIDKPRKREVPFVLIPGLREITTELAANAIDKRLSHYADKKQYNNSLESACAALEITHYSPHDLRRTALNWWEIDLRLPPHIVAIMAGHSLNVRDHYHKVRTAADLVKMMEGIRQENAPKQV